jgi:protein phosphatase
VDVNFTKLPLQNGDTVVLCSDGLHGQVSDDEIAGAAMGDSIEAACRELIDLANERGGPDNITVAMLRFEQRGGSGPSAWTRFWRGVFGKRKS